MLILVIPSATASFEWMDPVGDHELTFSTGEPVWRSVPDPYWNESAQWQAAGESHPFADLVRVALANETADSFLLEIEIAQRMNRSDEAYVGVTDAMLRFSVDGNMYLLTLATNPGPEERFYPRLLTWREKVDGGHEWVGPILSAQRHNLLDPGWYEDTARIWVPKADLRGANGIQPWVGAEIVFHGAALTTTYTDPERKEPCAESSPGSTCSWKVRDTLIADPYVHLMALAPDAYGPIMYGHPTEDTRGALEAVDRGYASAYDFRMPLYNIADKPVDASLQVEPNHDWRILYPSRVRLPPLGNISIPIHVETTGDQPTWGGATIAVRPDEGTTLQPWVSLRQPSSPRPTPSSPEMRLFVNHSRGNYQSSSWYSDNAANSAEGDHAPTGWRFETQDTVVTSHTGVIGSDVGYKLGPNSTVTAAFVFPGRFEGTFAASLAANDGLASDPISFVERPDVHAAAGDTLSLVEEIRVPTELANIPPGNNLELTLSLTGNFWFPPNGTTPQDYGLPASAQSNDGFIAPALKQNATRIRLDLEPYADPLDPALFPDPVIRVHAGKNSAFRSYGRVFQVNVNNQGQGVSVLNVTNDGLVPATVDWSTRGLAGLVQPHPSTMHIPPGETRLLQMNYGGDYCDYSSTSYAEGDLVGNDNPTSWTFNLAVGVHYEYDHLCMAPSDGVFTPGFSPLLALGGLAWAMRRKHA